MEGFKVIIAADASQGINAVAKFNAELSKTGAKVPALTTAITKVNTSLNSVKGSSNTAGQALMNLGRIAQDAPFGFIGIANNINPLLESFQRLRAESGSTKTALASLASGLLGGAGIGLAVSVITGLLTVFGDRLFKTAKVADEAAESAKKYADAQRSSAESLQKQVIEVESLVRIAQSDVSTKEQQRLALARLNEIIPDNIGKVNALNIKTQEGISIIRQYTKALEDQATAELLRGRAAEFRVKLLDAERKHNDEVLKQKLLIAAEQKKLDAGDTASAQTRASESFAIRQQKYAQNILASRKAIVQSDREFIKAQSNFLTELITVQSQINAATLGGLPVSAPPPEKIKPLGPLTVPVREIKLDPTKVILLPTDLTNFEGLDRLSDKIAGQLKIIEHSGVESPIGAIFSNALERAEELAGFISSTLAPAFSAVFETIVSGGGNALQAFGNAIKRVVAQLVAAAVQAAIFATIMLIASGGASGVFQGRFLDMFGKLSGFKLFGDGGIVQGPMSAIIGERGPEAVIPLRDLNKVMRSIGGGNRNETGFVASTSISGQHLNILIERAKNQYGGTFS